jgi:predicted dehydrogenase
VRSGSLPAESSGYGLAVVGVGFGQRGIIEAARLAGIPVRVVCAAREERAREAASAHGIPAWTTNVEEATQHPGVSLVCVTSPPALHLRHVQIVATAGVSVLCEKPLAPDLGEAVELEQVTRGLEVAAVDHELRFLPTRLALRDLVRGGGLGELRSIVVVDDTSSLSDPAAPCSAWWARRELGGGQVAAVAWHWLDWIRWSFGEIASVGAAMRTTSPERPTREGDMVTMTAEDSAVVTCVLADGAIATIATSSVAPARHLTVRVAGSHGEAAIDVGGRLRVRMARQGRSAEVVRDGVRLGAGEVYVGQIAALSRLLSALRRAAEEQDADPYPTVKDGVAVQRLVAEAHVSTSSRVPIRPTEETP